MFKRINMSLKMSFFNEFIKKKSSIKNKQFNNYLNFCYYVEIYLIFRYVIKHVNIELFCYAMRRITIIF